VGNFAQVSSASGFIGTSSSSISTANVTHSTWTNSGNLYVGDLGNGNLIANNSGHITSSTGYIGYATDSIGKASIVGIVPLSAPSSWGNTGDLYVGYSGNGTLGVVQGAQVSNLSGHIGYAVGSTGAALVTGFDQSASTWTNGGALYIGESGNGTLNISDGGVVRNTDSYIGYAAGANGAVTVTGNSSAWITSGSLYVGANGSGSLTVSNVGDLSATGVTASNFIVGALGEIHGAGFLRGAVQNGGLVAPGNPMLALNIFGSYSQSAAGTLAIELAGTTPSTQYDQLRILGGAVTWGGTLQVSLSNGFVPAVGNSFDILDWTGSSTGAFATINLPVLPGGRAWNTSLLYTTGQISVSLAGDFNMDGKVDAADYVVWRKGLGTTYTQNDYNVWRFHFGQTAGSGSGVTASAAVPESTTLVLLMLAAAGWCLRRGRTA
jgi:T5SS/PEP-CTERM-associated repeat protein